MARVIMVRGSGENKKVEEYSLNCVKQVDRFIERLLWLREYYEQKGLIEPRQAKEEKQETPAEKAKKIVLEAKAQQPKAQPKQQQKQKKTKTTDTFDTLEMFE